MAGIVMFFDFDRTIIDGDSDNWVVKEMGLTQLFEQLITTLPWNSLMDKMMGELHSQGRTIGDIEECLKKVYMNPRIVAAIEAAYASGCDLRIVSDANKFFIETILKHYGLLGCFSEIYTNPTSVDEQGRLRIFPYHDSTLSPHGCSLCPYNMCKSLVIEQLQAAPSNRKKYFIYIGDGNGDICPSSKLGPEDYVLPRKNFPLLRHINSYPELVKAEVVAWGNGEELEKVLLLLIERISIEDKSGTVCQTLLVP